MAKKLTELDKLIIAGELRSERRTTGVRKAPESPFVKCFNCGQRNGVITVTNRGRIGYCYACKQEWDEEEAQKQEAQRRQDGITGRIRRAIRYLGVPSSSTNGNILDAPTSPDPVGGMVCPNIQGEENPDGWSISMEPEQELDRASLTSNGSAAASTKNSINLCNACRIKLSPWIEQVGLLAAPRASETIGENYDRSVAIAFTQANPKDYRSCLPPIDDLTICQRTNCEAPNLAAYFRQVSQAEGWNLNELERLVRQHKIGRGNGIEAFARLYGLDNTQLSSTGIFDSRVVDVANGTNRKRYCISSNSRRARERNEESPNVIRKNTGQYAHGEERRQAMARGEDSHVTTSHPESTSYECTSERSSPNGRGDASDRCDGSQQQPDMEDVELEQIRENVGGKITQLATKEMGSGDSNLHNTILEEAKERLQYADKQIAGASKSMYNKQALSQVTTPRQLLESVRARKLPSQRDPQSRRSRIAANIRTYPDGKHTLVLRSDKVGNPINILTVLPDGRSIVLISPAQAEMLLRGATVSIKCGLDEEGCDDKIIRKVREDKDHRRGQRPQNDPSKNTPVERRTRQVHKIDRASTLPNKKPQRQQDNSKRSYTEKKSLPVESGLGTMETASGIKPRSKPVGHARTKTTYGSYAKCVFGSDAITVPEVVDRELTEQRRDNIAGRNVQTPRRSNIGRHDNSIRKLHGSRGHNIQPIRNDKAEEHKRRDEGSRRERPTRRARGFKQYNTAHESSGEDCGQAEGPWVTYSSRSNRRRRRPRDNNNQGASKTDRRSTDPLLSNDRTQTHRRRHNDRVRKDNILPKSPGRVAPRMGDGAKPR